MNNIGLTENYKKGMVEKLNAYLSSVQITYMNVRGYHWNIVGKQFLPCTRNLKKIITFLMKWRMKLLSAY